MNTGREFDSICIPVSPVLLVQEDFLEQVTKVLETYQIPKGKLALEVDDSALSNVYLNVNITMQELSDMGVELVLNNFGSGCAPISSILDLPIHTVKLERMFVWQLETNPKSASIAGGLIQIARELNYLYHLASKGMIPCVKRGRTLRFDMEELKKWMQQQYVPASNRLPDEKEKK